MKSNLRTLCLILVTIMTLSSCYKKLYQSCSSDKKNLQIQNQSLTNEANSIRGQNSALQKEKEKVLNDNTSLKADNVKLKEENSVLKTKNEAEAAKTKRFSLTFRQLCCDKTTELGADEVYIVVIGSKIGSGDICQRIPGDNSHWDMNDGNQPSDNPSGDSHCLTNRTLFSGELKPGESYFINVAICEEDGGTTKRYQDIASEIAKQSGDPYVAAAGIIVGALTKFGLYHTDTDDWMGMFGIRITNTDGNILASWVSKEGITTSINDPSYPNNPLYHAFVMNHDGSRYAGYFNIQY